MVRPLVFLLYQGGTVCLTSRESNRAKRSFGVFVVKKVHIWGGNGRDLSLRDN